MKVTPTTFYWPPLPWDDWKDTAATLHLYLQVVGKIKLVLAPFLNEWWNVALHVTARGITTGMMPYENGGLELVFDFHDQVLRIHVESGASREIRLVSRPVSDFYSVLMTELGELGVRVKINTLPSEVPAPVRFEDDDSHRSYDGDAVKRWWRIQAGTAMALQRFRSGFVGKSSPINLFWGSLDLSHTRFSGRPATPPKGAPRFFQIAEDQENIAFGFWPGNANMAGYTFGEPAFYSYAFPEPAGFRDLTVEPADAYFHDTLGEFVLPYDSVRRAASPAAALIGFFESVYRGASDLGGWDRTRLERHPVEQGTDG